jgi:hypothetical protein
MATKVSEDPAKRLSPAAADARGKSQSAWQEVRRGRPLGAAV